MDGFHVSMSLMLPSITAKHMKSFCAQLVNTNIAQKEQKMLNRLKRHQFLFEELVKRDFKKKYKRTVLGMAWRSSPTSTSPPARA